MEKNTFHSGVVAVIGRPNVGKSSLLNRILDYKLSIVSEKPQTTRDNILGIYNSERMQIVFVDTPGIHRPHNKLGEKLVDRALAELDECDLILFVVSINENPKHEENLRIAKLLEVVKRPVLLVVNKVDLPGSKGKVLPLIDAFRKMVPLSDAAVPVSAKEGTNADTLLTVVEQLLPEGPPLYPDDMLTDRSERFIAQEIIREKVIVATEEEVPHSVAVEIDEYRSPDEYPERKDLYIRATVYVEREGQKAIILGKKGEKIKAIGTAARKAIETMTGHKVFIELWVKVNEGWRNSETKLKKMGYE